MVVFNPGVVTSGGWNMHHGFICNFENSDENFDGLKNDLASLTPDQKKRSVILIHGLPQSDWEDRFNWLDQNGIRNFYFTSKVFNQHPWNFDSPYFSAMVDKIK